MERKIQLVTKLLGSNDTPGFFPDDSGECYKRVVKISPEFPNVEPGTKVDAVGHALHVGDRIACRRPSEAGGNTVKGFMLNFIPLL